MTVKRRAAKVPQISAPAMPASPALTIEPCYGIVAVLHDGYLQIRQADSEGHTDSLMLSRFEVRRLFEEFEAWANA